MIRSMGKSSFGKSVDVFIAFLLDDARANDFNLNLTGFERRSPEANPAIVDEDDAEQGRRIIANPVGMLLEVDRALTCGFGSGPWMRVEPAGQVRVGKLHRDQCPRQALWIRPHMARAVI